MRITLTCIFMIMTLIACAATYTPPVTLEVDHTESLPASKTDIFNATKQVLTKSGYEIQSSDEASGTITTTFSQIKLDENQCDCGTKMGVPYIKDNRTITNVAINAVIDEHQASIRADIHGKYIKEEDSVSIAIDCVSTGTIEKTLLGKIVSTTLRKGTLPPSFKKAFENGPMQSSPPLPPVGK